MNRLQKIKTLVGVFVTFVFCACFMSDATFAEGPSISISPTIDRISLDPGEIHTGSVTIRNTSDIDYDFVMEVSPYRLSDKESTTSLSNYTQITDWITLSAYDGHLAAGEKKEILYMVKTPVDTPAGGQYAIISAGFQTDTTYGAVNVSGAVGTIIYARVAGETRESGSIQNIRITGFTLIPTISASATLENTGNVDAAASLSLVIKSAITGQEVYSTAANPPEYSVIPDSVRTATIEWGEAPIVGAFNATFSVNYLNESKTINKFIIICPIWIIFLISALIIAIIVRIVASSKHRTGRRSRSSKFSL